MAAEEEYQRTGFEGKDLKAIDTLLRTYFDASGWEFSELIQANRNYYIKQGAFPHSDTIPAGPHKSLHNVLANLPNYRWIHMGIRPFSMRR